MPSEAKKVMIMSNLLKEHQVSKIDETRSQSLQLSPERLGPCGSAAELQLCLGPIEKDPCCETIHSDIFAIDMYSQLILLYDFKCSAKSA